MGLLCKAHKKLLGQPDAISLHNKWPTHTHSHLGHKHMLRKEKGEGRKEKGERGKRDGGSP